MAAKGKVKPERLPATEEAVKQHCLRAYLQVHDWMLLQTQSLDPTKFGWQVIDSTFHPIGTTAPIAPDALLKFICCSCKTECNNNRCGCKRSNVNCLTACKCNEDICKNRKDEEIILEDE